MGNETHSSSREYYGFVLYISTFVCLFLYFIWALFGEHLKVFGFALPSRYWAVVVPIWIVGLIPFTILITIGYNLLHTRDLDSFDMLTDKYARVFSGSAKSIEKILDNNKIPPLEDVPISIVNSCWKREFLREEE